ncbi:MAG: hypothetical protein GYA56_06475 [Geobacteraceae bacterium]|nr:hypothetical protein [Geobacteraceae bacterium]
MRKHEVIEIDSKKFTVSELRVKDLLSVIRGEDGRLGAVTVSEVVRKATEVLPLAVDCPVEELKGLAPSELEAVWEAFKRVNAVFFRVAGALGLTGVLEDLKNSAVRVFSTLYFSSLSAATDRASGSMDTATS